MKAGDVLITGHIATEAEAKYYNSFTDWIESYETAHPNIVPGSLVDREYQFRLDQRHRFYVSIMNNEAKTL